MNTPSLPLAGSIAKLCLAASFALTSLTHAADQTWTGSANNSFSNGSNWDSGSAPVSGDSWNFGASGTGGYTLNNNLTSDEFQVAGIRFGSGASAYTISGNAFQLTGNITNTVNLAHTISSNIVVSGSSTISQTSVSGNNSFAITLSGSLSGSGSITQSGATGGVTNLNLSGNNSGFTGSFTALNNDSVRTMFQNGNAGSASAAWTFNRTVNGGVGLTFANATISFGSLSGGGFVRAGGNGTTTVSVGALNTSTTFSGKFQQSATNTVIKLEKVGSGTLTLTGSNEHLGGTEIKGGSLFIGANNVLADAGKMTLSGGTLEIGAGFSDTLGTLELTSDSVIKLGLGSSLVFSNSASLDWDEWNLTIDGNFLTGSSIRFGTTNASLTGDQINQISILGYTNLALDNNGFLVAEAIPEPGAAALVLLAGGAMLVRRRLS